MVLSKNIFAFVISANAFFDKFIQDCQMEFTFDWFLKPSQSLETAFRSHFCFDKKLYPTDLIKKSLTIFILIRQFQDSKKY